MILIRPLSPFLIELRQIRSLFPTLRSQIFQMYRFLVCYLKSTQKQLFCDTNRKALVQEASLSGLEDYRFVLVTMDILSPEARTLSRFETSEAIIHEFQ